FTGTLAVHGRAGHLQQVAWPLSALLQPTQHMPEAVCIECAVQLGITPAGSGAEDHIIHPLRPVGGTLVEDEIRRNTPESVGQASGVTTQTADLPTVLKHAQAQRRAHVTATCNYQMLHPDCFPLSETAMLGEIFCMSSIYPMTLTELRYIVTLAQEQHFGHAAERCHVSQPTLSVGVKKLEEELGVLLFERTKSAVRVTPIGEKIVAQAQRVLEEAMTIRVLANAGKNQLSAPLKVGTIYTIGPYLFPHLIPQLHRVAPEMPLYIEEDYTHNLRDKLRNGELDAIIVALPFSEPDILTKPLYDEPFSLLIPADHPWADRQDVSLDDLDDDRLLLLGEGHCFREQVLEACPTTRRGDEQGKHTTIESSSLETIRHMVASGMGMTVLPMSAADDRYYRSDLLLTKPFKAPVPFRTVAIAWRASFPRPKAVDLLSDSIRLCSIGTPATKG